MGRRLLFLELTLRLQSGLRFYLSDISSSHDEGNAQQCPKFLNSSSRINASPTKTRTQCGVLPFTRVTSHLGLKSVSISMRVEVYNLCHPLTINILIEEKEPVLAH